MISYKYTARNPSTGKLVKSSIQAETEQAAAKILKADGLVPIDLKPERAADSKGPLGFLNRVRMKDKVLFFNQLSTLIDAGLPLSQSLRNVAEQTPNKNFRLIINRVITQVEGGQSLSKAMAAHPEVFNRVAVNLVAAGETSGTLDKALKRIAIQQEKDANIASKVKGAMIYPALILCVMVAVVLFMVIKVVPQIQFLYTTFPGSSLPIETRVLLDFSNFLKRFWWESIIAIIILVLFLTRWLRSKDGTRFLDYIKLNMPPFKALFRMIYMARFSRTSGTLIGAGVPLLQVLEITAENIANYYVSESILKAAEKVKGGKSLGDTLTGDPNFLPLVPNMLKIGEESGSLEAMMDKAATYYENEVDNIINNISKVIEPIMMIVLGLVAILIITAILLPIYGLAGSGAISAGGQ